MESYRETAFYLALWYAVIAAVVALLLIVLNYADVATGFLIAANVSLLFALLLIAAVNHLTDRRIRRGQFLRTVPPKARVPGDAGLRMARQALNEEWLRFAKGASAVAIVLGVCAFLGNSTSRGAWANAVRGTSVAPAQQVQSAPLSYRAAWTLPTN